MNVFLNIKLIARNWWRNKLFFLISLFSLTAGLGCTNLLMTFFIHEYNVEKYNTDRNLIYLLRQDSPMEEGIKVAYSTSDAATQIKEKYAEITDILRVNGMSGNLCKYNGTDIKQFLFISADSTLNQFFPYTTSEGSLEEVLTTPDKVAVNKRFAHQLFGNHSGIGEILEIYTAYSKGSGRMWRKNTETSSRWATPCVWTSRWKQAQARHTYIHTPSLNCTNVMA